MPFSFPEAFSSKSTGHVNNAYERAAVSFRARPQPSPCRSCDSDLLRLQGTQDVRTVFSQRPNYSSTGTSLVVPVNTQQSKAWLTLLAWVSTDLFCRTCVRKISRYNPLHYYHGTLRNNMPSVQSTALPHPPLNEPARVSALTQHSSTIVAKLGSTESWA